MRLLVPIIALLVCIPAFASDIEILRSDRIHNDSGVTGDTVTEALDALAASGGGGTVVVTVGPSPYDYSDVHAAIDYVHSKNGGTIIIAQDFLRILNAQNKDISNITFRSRKPNLGTGSFIRFDGGSGQWSGYNVRFENFKFAVRGTYLGAAPFKALGSEYWTFSNCQFGSSGFPSQAKPLFDFASKESYVTFHNTRQVQTTKPFSINDSVVTMNMYDNSSVLVTSIAALYKDASSSLIGGSVGTTYLVDKTSGMANDSSVTGTTVKDALETLAASGSTLEWVTVDLTYSDFSDASTQKDIDLYSLPANAFVHAAYLKHSAPFTGGSVSAYVLSIGTAVALDSISSDFDVFQATGPRHTSQVLDTFSEAGVTSIRIRATSTGDTLDNATAGAVRVRLLVSNP
jgi:hypothetical protein